MLAEALVLANPFLFFPGRDGQPRRMSECPTDLHAYWRLGEYIVQQIENSTDEVVRKLIFTFQYDRTFPR